MWQRINVDDSAEIRSVGFVYVCCSVWQCVAVCGRESCRVLQSVTVCCRVLQGVAGCCRVLQGVAVCSSVWQCVNMNDPPEIRFLGFFLSVL